MNHIMILFNRLINSKPLLWFLLAIPAIPFLKNIVISDVYSSEALYRTGVISTQLLVFTLAITPITQLLKKKSIGRGVNRWLLQRRRNFGVASFAYAMLHVLIYLIENNDWQIVWREAVSIEYGSGWLALIVILPLAMTSNNFSMRVLGKRWKKVQQYAYLLAALTFLHWISFGFFVNPGLQLLAILLIFKTIQLWINIFPRKSAVKDITRSVN